MEPRTITPELTWPDGKATGTRIRVGSTDRQHGTIQVAWWSDRFPLYIYGVHPDGRLAWYRHDGALVGGGLESWGATQMVGRGWQDVAHVFAAGNGVIYAITDGGELRWYRHGGYRVGGGLETWEPQNTGYRVVGHGWSGVRHVFWGGNGVIYAVMPDGELRWYKHNGYPNGGGLETWEPQDAATVLLGMAGETSCSLFRGRRNHLCHCTFRRTALVPAAGYVHGGGPARERKTPGTRWSDMAGRGSGMFSEAETG